MFSQRQSISVVTSAGCDAFTSRRNERGDAGQPRPDTDATCSVETQTSAEKFEHRQRRNGQGINHVDLMVCLHVSPISH